MHPERDATTGNERLERWAGMTFAWHEKLQHDANDPCLACPRVRVCRHEANFETSSPAAKSMTRILRSCDELLAKEGSISERAKEGQALLEDREKELA